MSIFSLSEFQSRLEQVKNKMAHQGIDTLIVFDPANMNYLTGYDGWSFYVPQVVIVAQSCSKPIWIGREQDAHGARLTCWFDGDAIKSYEDFFLHSNTRHPMDFVAQVLREQRLHRGYIGIEMDAYYCTATSYHKLVENLPDAKLCDATLLVNWIRIIKSNWELRYIRQAAEIVTKTMNVAMQHIRPGEREADVAAEIFASQIRGTGTITGDYPAIVPLIPSNERTAAAHLSWTNRQYEEGDAINIEIAGCVNRYHCPLSRSAVIGVPNPLVQTLADVVTQGINAALDVVKPGVTCGEVETTWQRTIQNYGFEKKSRLGYAVGLNYPPDWGEHTASLRSDDPTILQPQMVFHMIAGMWMEGYGVELSETFVVTQSGCDVLANVDRKLFVLPS